MNLVDTVQMNSSKNEIYTQPMLPETHKISDSDDGDDTATYCDEQTGMGGLSTDFFW